MASKLKCADVFGWTVVDRSLEWAYVDLGLKGLTVSVVRKSCSVVRHSWL